MSAITDIAEAYRAEVTRPWAPGLSAPERVWMLIYPPHRERRIRARIPELANATEESGKVWSTVDLTVTFGQWIGSHEYAEAFFADPTNLTEGSLEDFEDEIAARIGEALDAADNRCVVALIGIGALYPFVRVSHLLRRCEPHLVGRNRGRLLVLFPGTYDETSYNYRLVDARDGFNYRARPILAGEYAKGI